MLTRGSADNPRAIQRQLPPDVRALLVKQLAAALAKAWRGRHSGDEVAGERDADDRRASGEAA